MSLHDKIKEITQDMKVYDFDGDAYGAYLIGFREVVEKTTEMAIKYDDFMDGVEEMMKTVISMQAGSFSSDEGSSSELNSIADMAEEMLVKIKEIKQ